MSKQGFLIIIGGAEDKTGQSEILSQAPQLLGPEDSLIILTTATQQPRQAGETYLSAFEALGLRNVRALHVDTRREANDPALAQAVRQAKGVFFTGGDQLRLTSILGGTAVCAALRALYAAGGVIMGTSAGASAMSSTMIVQGPDLEPARKCTLKMAPGLGLADGVIIDQHFDQRGRFGRLLCGVAENPQALGIGIDEDTAVKLHPDLHFEVLGQGAVTLIDGSSIQSSNVSQLEQDQTLAVAGVTVHVLPRHYGYDLKSRKVLRLDHET